MANCFSKDNVHEMRPEPIRIKRPSRTVEEPVSGASTITRESDNLFAKISSKEREFIFQKSDDYFQQT